MLLSLLLPLIAKAATDAAQIERWNAAAAQGDVEAQYQLGMAYKNGEAVAKDPEKAVEWFRQASEQEHARANYELGMAYSEGLGSTQDKYQAVYMFRLAAKKGFVLAQDRLGWAYLKGDGADKDEARAAFWFRKAADQGDAWAQQQWDALPADVRAKAADPDAPLANFQRTAEAPAAPQSAPASMAPAPALPALPSAPAPGGGAGSSLNGALTQDDLVTLLQVGSAPAEIATELSKRGYAGPTDVAALLALKNAGADTALLTVIRKAAAGATAMAPSAATVSANGAPWGGEIDLHAGDNVFMKMRWVEPLGIYVGECEVTNEQYLAGETDEGKGLTLLFESAQIGDDFTRDAPQSANWVTWNGADDFCQRITKSLAERNSRLPNIGGWKVDLPSGKEWSVFVGDAQWDTAVNSSKQALKEPVLGTSGPANNFGLRHVYGNLAEWCTDREGTRFTPNVAGGTYLTRDFKDSQPRVVPPGGYQDLGFRCVLRPVSP